MKLFEAGAKSALAHTVPLAERMRPSRLADFIGQEKTVGEGRILRKAIAEDKIFSMVLWGPPGSGKTTLARIVAGETRSHFVQISAVLSGVKDIRTVIEEAKKQREFHQKRTILFVDEIHRFNKAQQDAFLHHVESGLITLIGATTENPSFEIIAPLLSRCRVITLEALSPEALREIIRRALEDEENGLGKKGLTLSEAALDFLVRISDGDGRTALNTLELVGAVFEDAETTREKRVIELPDLEKALQEKSLLYDKGGEEHYNLISALHKSLRGSDPDAALYWLARMLKGGEDPLFIARRMVRFASEDVGNADPTALQVALNAMESFRFLGPPEGELALAQAAVYLATAPKSNAIYTAYAAAQEAVKRSGSLPVPHHIRNAPTRLMKELGYAEGYKYAHDFKDAYAPQDYFPEPLKGTLFYHPTQRGYEKIVKQRLDKWRELKKKGRIND